MGKRIARDLGYLGRRRVQPHVPTTGRGYEFCTCEDVLARNCTGVENSISILDCSLLYTTLKIKVAIMDTAFNMPKQHSNGNQ